MSANTEYTEIQKELATAKTNLENLLEEISKLFERFTDVEFDQEEETEEIEARIAKLEDVLDEMDDEDSQSVLQNKIAKLNDTLTEIEKTVELREELAELFKETKEAMNDLELDTE